MLLYVFPLNDYIYKQVNTVTLDLGYKPLCYLIIFTLELQFITQLPAENKKYTILPMLKYKAFKTF